MPFYRYGLTIMVNNIIKSRFNDVDQEQLDTLNTDSPQRVLPNKVPLYPIDELLGLISNLQSEDDEDDFFYFATDDSRVDWHKLVMRHDGVILTKSGATEELRPRHFFEVALSQAQFKKSELCKTSKPQRWLACDVYVFDLEYWRADLRKEYPVKVYLKFALNGNGTVALICSLHDD